MDDQGWPPGGSGLFALATSLALWTVPLVLSVTFA
jgi:hypothetical protein